MSQVARDFCTNLTIFLRKLTSHVPFPGGQYSVMSNQRPNQTIIYPILTLSTRDFGSNMLKHSWSSESGSIWKLSFFEIYSLFVILILKPSFGRRMSSPNKVKSSRLSTASTLYFLSTLDIIAFSSSIANFCPMQFLGPAENGIYENGCRPTQFSGRNRSGSYLSGCLKLSGLR